MAADICIRTCSPGDDHALAVIGQATFLETYASVLAGPDILAYCATSHSIDTYRRWLTKPDYKLWLAEVRPGHAPVGYMVTAPADLPLPDVSPRDVEIRRIYVFSKYQGGGLGKRLANEAIADSRTRQAQRLLLGVYSRNEAAIGFYTHMGFRHLGTRKFQVGSQTCDDNIMGLSL
ncbi:MAG: GNAT family N-acetyltransferase [Gammaproteobacteria bacterium]